MTKLDYSCKKGLILNRWGGSRGKIRQVAVYLVLYINCEEVYQR